MNHPAIGDPSCMETLKSSKLFIDRCSLLNHPALGYPQDCGPPPFLSFCSRIGKVKKSMWRSLAANTTSPMGCLGARLVSARVGTALILGGFHSQYPQLWDLSGMHWTYDLGLVIGIQKEFAGWFLLGKIYGWELGVALWRKIVGELEYTRWMKPLYAVFFGCENAVYP